MPRRLIVCCDGTWNEPYQEGSPRNVAMTVRAIKPSAGDVSQVVYYDAGIGTGNWYDKLVGGGFGKGLGQNVQDAYLFLVANFQQGDEIYLFGFSRGAYTVRSVAGLLGVVGMLRKTDLDRFPKAYAFYKTKKEDRTDALSAELLPDYLRQRTPQPFHFLGVWDTVGALGIPGPLRKLSNGRHQFHDVALGAHVRHAYHALAIDEHRKSFEPSLWDNKPADGQIVEQVWFCGAHSNIGGGYPNARLSHICWRWMLEKAEKAGLAIDQDFVKRVTDGRDIPRRIDPTAQFPWKLLPKTQRAMLSTQHGTEAIHDSVGAFLKGSASDIDPHPYDPADIRRLRDLYRDKEPPFDSHFRR